MSPDQELEKLLGVLIERFGASRSLGEVLAATYTLRLSREGRHISMSEFAAETGISKKNLSRWALEAVRKGRLHVQPHDDDHRKKRFAIVNLDRAGRHLPAVARAFGTEVDPPRRDRLARSHRK